MLMVERKVAVIGVGITRFGEVWEKGLRQLLAEAELQALADARINPEKVDMIFTGNMCGGEFAGQEHLGGMASSILNLNVASTRVEGACASGSLAFRQGLMAIESGRADMVLVNGVEKMTDVSTEHVTTGLMGAGDEEWEGFQGFTFPGLYALMAKAYMNKFGLSRKQLAAVAVKNHFHGARNPIAQYRKEITLDDVYKSMMVAEPLTLLDCSPITDGAASVVLCNAETAKQYCEAPVYVAGSGQASDTLALAERSELHHVKATRLAKTQAFAQAKITVKDLDLVEVHDCFTIAEIMAMEDLGLCGNGKAGRLVEQGQTYFDGKTPVNTSGGLKACGHPVGATGVKQVVEVVQQLQGKAGKRQVKGAEIGVTHNVGGSGATVVVNVFKRGLP